VLVPAIVALLGIMATVVIAHRVAVAAGDAALDRRLTEVAGDIDARMDRAGGLVTGAAAHFSTTAHSPAGTTDAALTAYMAARSELQLQRDTIGGISYVLRSFVEDLPAALARRHATMPDLEIADGPPQVYQAILWAKTPDGPGQHGDRVDADPDLSTALSEAQMTGQVVMSAPGARSRADDTAVQLFAPVRQQGDVVGWITADVAIGDVIADATNLQVEDHGLTVHPAAGWSTTSSSCDDPAIGTPGSSRAWSATWRWG
jgi:hypothetical protein